MDLKITTHQTNQTNYRYYYDHDYDARCTVHSTTASFTDHLINLQSPISNLQSPIGRPHPQQICNATNTRHRSRDLDERTRHIIQTHHLRRKPRRSCQTLRPRRRGQLHRRRPEETRRHVQRYDDQRLGQLGSLLRPRFGGE